MMETISNPLATATFTWLSPEEGGRKSGPPTAPVYVSTCVFPLGGEQQVQPGWPAEADEMFSILLEEIETVGSPSTRRYNVDFLTPDLVAQFVQPGAQVIVLEGPKVVALGQFDEVFNR
ncbi:hypothetical protein [Arthrobacter sp. A2-55]|uniref:hypothetical protein n=1 Tax=Arthrobacter sp. A2-55 TaxID=2897337 RepID=UPI0021CDD54B|nr:hypothetical protein [Arthrobacter sp. A2-55]MCU6480535.1 hypothetical protein [Arthrobacter sp. A2-55]